MRTLPIRVTVLMLCAVAASPVLAREYAIPEISVDVEVRGDGTIRISEDRTYVYDGAYSRANYRLPKSGFTRIRDIRVQEGGTAYVNENSERAGTFLVEESNDAIDLRWFYDAQDERRTFTIAYTLDGAVVTGREWSEFFWNYVAAERERPTERLSIAIRLPAAVPEDSLHAWARGPRSRIGITESPGRYDVMALDVGAHESVGIRTVFPTSVFERDVVPITANDFSLASARDDEQRFEQAEFRRAERETARAALGRQLTFLIVILSIASYALWHRRYGRRPDIPGSPSPLATLSIPSDLPPAVIGWLMAGRRCTARHLSATLFDLARRGYFEITEQAPKRRPRARGQAKFAVKSTDKVAGSGLLAWEASVLGFVRGELRGREVDLDTVFNQSSGVALKWFSAWRRAVRADGFARRWVDKASVTAVYWNVGTQAVLVLASVIAASMAGPVALIALAVSVVAALLSGAIARRTPEGEAVFRKWTGYKNALTNARDHAVRTEELGRHFIYAVAFGVRKRGIESLFEAHPDVVTYLLWISLLDSTKNSPAAVGEAFSALNAAGTTTFGGAGGGVVAGGASVGSAGGGASGGAA